MVTGACTAFGLGLFYREFIRPSGDQPRAIEELQRRIGAGVLGDGAQGAGGKQFTEVDCHVGRGKAKQHRVGRTRRQRSRQQDSADMDQHG